MEREKTNPIDPKVQDERPTYTPPVYPVVNIPVPDLDWKEISGKNIPCCMKLLVYIIAKLLP